MVILTRPNRIGRLSCNRGAGNLVLLLSWVITQLNLLLIQKQLWAGRRRFTIRLKMKYCVNRTSLSILADKSFNNSDNSNSVSFAIFCTTKDICSGRTTTATGVFRAGGGENEQGRRMWIVLHSLCYSSRSTMMTCEKLDKLGSFCFLKILSCSSAWREYGDLFKKMMTLSCSCEEVFNSYSRSSLERNWEADVSSVLSINYWHAVEVRSVQPNTSAATIVCTTLVPTVRSTPSGK